MVNHDEQLEKARAQLLRVCEEWQRLYLSPRGDDDVSVELFDEDARHSPPPLRTFVTTALDETLDTILDKLQAIFPEDQVSYLGQSPAYGYAMNAMYITAKVLAIRCFEMGYTLRNELPYDELVPCACKTDAIDDVLEKLFAETRVKAGLKGHMLEGDGWVIVDFDPNRATVMKGKAHWLRKEV